MGRFFVGRSLATVVPPRPRWARNKFPCARGGREYKNVPHPYFPLVILGRGAHSRVKPQDDKRMVSAFARATCRVGGFLVLDK